MNPNPISVFDAFLNVVGVVAIWPALYRLHIDEKHNPFEEVVKWMLTLLSAFWFVRIFFDFFAMTSLGGLLYACAIGFAFCAFLFFEILLRRHYPLWFKVYLSLGLFSFAVLSLCGLLEGKKNALVAFGAYVLSLVAVVFLLMVFRKRSDYGKRENISIATSVWFLLVLAPLFLTDVAVYQIPYVPPLGICGGLIFTYFSIYNQALFFGKGFLLRKLSKSVAASAVLTLAMQFLLKDADWVILGRIFVLFLEVFLLFRIYFATYYLNGEDEMHLFVDHVNEVSKKSIPSFLLQMKEHYNPFEAYLLRPSDLSEAGSKDLKWFFDAVRMVMISGYEVSNWLLNEEHRWNSKELEAIERIRDLLETHEKSHLCKLGGDKPYFVLFNCPFISYQKILDSQTELLAQLSLLIERKD